MNRFLHIGYPKCFSTSLQKAFFSKHKDIHYGGVGISSNIDYIDDDLNLLFESGLTYFNNKLFKKVKDRFQSRIEVFFEDAVRKNKKIGGFSSEHISFNFSPQGLEQEIKFDRIHELFGSETKIILVKRNLDELLKSIYLEFVKMGMKLSFEKYLEWLYKYQDRNFFWDLHYPSTVRLLEDRFKNVLVLNFEDYKNQNNMDSIALMQNISSFLEISTASDYHFDNHNKSLDLNLAYLLSRDDEFKYDFSSSHLEGIEDHRREIYFNKFLGLNYDESAIYNNVKYKQKNISKNKLLLDQSKVNSKHFWSTPKANEFMQKIINQLNAES